MSLDDYYDTSSPTVPDGRTVLPPNPEGSGTSAPSMLHTFITARFDDDHRMISDEYGVPNVLEVHCLQRGPLGEDGQSVVADAELDNCAERIKDTILHWARDSNQAGTGPLFKPVLLDAVNFALKEELVTLSRMSQSEWSLGGEPTFTDDDRDTTASALMSDLLFRVALNLA